MAALIYALCALTALTCAFLLLRGYTRLKSGMLLWSGICFAGLAANNFLLVLDRIFLPGTDLLTIRLFTALIALLPLLYGLIWTDE